MLLAASSLTTCRLDDLLSPGEVGRLSVAPLLLLDSARVGSAALRSTAASLTIQGPGSSIRFGASTVLNSPWIALSAPTGVAPGSFSITLDPAGLSVGEHLDTLRLSAEGPEAAQLLVPVRFLVQPCAVVDLASIPATVNGTLTASDCGSVQQPGRFATRFRFNGTANDSLTVQLASAAFATSVSLEREGILTPIAQSATCPVVGSGACLRYVRLPSTGAYVVEVTSVAAAGTGAFVLTVGRPRAPTLPTALVQRTAGVASLAVAVGATITTNQVALQAALADPDLDSLRLELEVRPVGAAFTGTATSTSPLGRGPVFSLNATGLLDDAAYQWQARAVDATGRASAWTSFGGNAAGATDFAVAVPQTPGVPTVLVQRRSDGTTPIAGAGTTDENLVRLGATLSDPDPGDNVRLEVEVRAAGNAFSDLATVSSAPVTSGVATLVTVVGLSDDGSYRWQARTVDASGGASAWVANSVSGADFRIALAPARLAVTVQPVATAAGAAITPSVRVVVQDAAGNTLLSFNGNVTIALGTNPSSGTLSGTSTVAAVMGVATFTNLAVDRAGTGYTLVASAGALTVTSAAFTVTSASAQGMTVGAVPAILVAGAAIAPAVQVTVRDALGNIATTFTGTVTLALAANGAGATLLGTTAVNAVAGLATFSAVRVERVGTVFSLVASATGLPNATSSAFAVTSAAAASVRIVTQPSASAASGAVLAPQPVVVIEDAFGNGVRIGGTLVTATVASGPAGAALAGASATTDTTGLAAFTGLAVSGPGGGYRLAFTASGLPDAISNTVELGAGSASQLAIATAPSSVASSGLVIAPGPVIALRDGAGNGVAQANVSVTASIASGSGTLTGTTTVLTDATGAAIFSDLAISGLIGVRSLAFTAAGLDGVTSGPITVGAGEAVQLTRQAGDAQSAVAGSAVAIAPSVLVSDASGNPVSGVSVTFALTAGGGAIAPLSAVVTGVDGIARLTSWTLGATVGANALSASVIGLSGSPVLFTATGTGGTASQLLVTAGDNLTGTVGGTLGTAHEVRVTDSNGNPVAGVTVVWTPIGGGSVNPTGSVTDADGRATTIRTLGPTPGPQTTTAAATFVGGPVSVTFTANATVGGATQLSQVGGDAQADTVGATLAMPLAVVARDALNNPVQGVLVTWSVIDGGGVLLPATSITDAAGVATTSWRLGTVTTSTDSTQLARASGVGSPVNFLATSRPGVVNAAQSLVSVAPATVAASRATPAVVTVTARDGFGNTIPAMPVTLVATGVGNTLVQPAATNASGVTTGAIGATVIGAHTITATVNGIAATQRPTLTVNAAPATALVLTVPPSDVVAGATLTPSPALGVLDSLGNRNLTFAGAVTLAIGTNPGAGALSGTLTRSAVAGVVTFPGLSIDRAAIGYTLTATSGTLSSVTSAAFTVTAGGVSPARSSVVVAPTSITAGTGTSTVTVTARDANDNPVAGANVVLTATGSGNTLTQSVAVTDTNGIATGSLASTVASVKVVSATIGGIAVSQSAAVTVVPGAVSAALSSIAAAPASIIAGVETSTVTVIARDANANPIPGVTVLLAATGPDNTVTQPAVTNASGVATGTIGSATAGTKTLSATIDGTAITSTATVQVTAGAISAAQSTVAVAPANIVAAAGASTITVTARDANGNAIAGATVVLSATGAGNTLTQPVAVTDASGVATGTLGSTLAGTKIVSATIGAISVTQTAGVTVTPGAVSALQSSIAAGPASVIAGVASTITVTARDASSNPVPNVTVVLAVTGTGNTLSQPTAVTDANGIATGTIASTVAQAKTVSATIAGVAITPTAALTVTPAAVSAAQSTVEVSSATISAAVGSTTVTVTARDAFANVVPGVTVVFAATGTGNTLTQPGAVTGATGVATGVFSSTVSESKVLSATAAGVAITQTAFVTVVPDAVSPSQSTISAVPGSIVAGVGTSTITVTARDASGNPVAGVTVALAASGTGNTLTQPSAVTGANGIATGAVASTVAGAKTVSATVNGVTVTTTAAVTVTPGAVSAALSTVAAAPGTIVAGVGTSTITVTARDANGNAIPGLAVVLAATGTGNALTQPALVGDANGVATGTFATTVAELKIISATIDAVAITQTAGVAATPGAISAAQSTVAVAPASVVAGVGSTTVTVTARDPNGNRIPGLAVVLAATGAGNTLTQPSTVTDSNGVATGTLASTVTGTKVVSATIDAIAVAQTASVTVTPGAISAALSTVAAAPGSIVAGTATSTITVTARDVNGNLIPGLSVVLAATGTGNTLAQPFVVTDATGVATGTIASTITGTKSITATVATVAITQSATVSVTAGAVSAAQSTVAVVPATIVAGTATSVITVTARDANGNVIPGATVLLAATGAGNTLIQPAAVTDADGVATGSIASTTASAKTVSATIDAVAITQQRVVIVTPGAVSATRSTVAVAPGAVVAGTGASTITVTALDENGNGVAGATVTLNATGAGNALVQPAAVTDANGVATGSLSSTASGVKTVSAMIGALPVTQTAAVTVIAGAVSAAQSRVVAAPDSIVAAGAVSTITVTARDLNGNPVEGATVVLAAPGAGNTLTQPAAVTDGTGVATGTLAATTVGAKTVTATIGAVAITQSATVTVTAGAISAAQSSVVVAPPSIVAGTATSTLTVTARDLSGNVVAGATVVLSATGGGNTITQPGAVTDANGVATGTIASTVTGAKTISATAGGVAIAQTAAVTITPGVLSAGLSTVTASPGGIVAGTATSTITVTARDVNGNLVPGLNVVLAATGTGNTLTQPSAVTNAAGVATGTIASTVAQGKTISATIGGVAIPLTATVTVTPATLDGATSTVASSAPTISAAVGSATLTVTARDRFGNAVPGVAVVISATGTGNTLTQPAAVTDSIGVATGSLSSTVSAAKVISATAGGTAIIQTVTVTVVPDVVSATMSTISATPASIVAGVGSSVVTVTARDVNGNPVAGVNVTLSVPGSGYTFTQPSAPTGVNGVASGSFISTIAGVRTVSAAINGVSLTSTAAVTVTVGAASLSASTVATSVPSITTGGSATITVLLRDAFGNDLSTSGGTVALATTLGTLSVVTNNNDGTYTAALGATTPGTATVSGTLDGAALSATAAVTVTAGAATRLAFVAQPAGTAYGTVLSAVVVELRDDFNNRVVTSSVPVTLALGTNPTSTSLTGGGATAAVTGRATFSALSVGSAGAGYTLVATSGSLTAATSTALNVTPALLAVSATARTKVYGAVDPTLTYILTSGSLVGTDVLSGVLTRVAGENVGTYAIQQGGLTAGANYAITFVPANLTITTAPLTVTASNAAKVYGAADPALTVSYSGFGNGDTTTALGGTLSVVRAAGESVGTYAITASGYNSANYVLAYVAATFTITAAPLTVTATARSKVYGTADPALTFTVTAGSLAGGDAFTGGLTRASGSDVGSYAIQQGSLSAGVNYALTYVPATLTITAAPLTVTGLTGVNKVYDRTTTATAAGTAALAGVVSGDVVALGGTPAFTFASTNVGLGIAITATGYTLIGAPAANYTLTPPTLSANITTAALTVTGLSGSARVYDRTTTATATGTAALLGVIAPDAVTLTGTPAYTFVSANVGTAIAITTTGYTLGGAQAANYALTQPALSANITARTTQCAARARRTRPAAPGRRQRLLHAR